MNYIEASDNKSNSKKQRRQNWQIQQNENEIGINKKDL